MILIYSKKNLQLFGL